LADLAMGTSALERGDPDNRLTRDLLAELHALARDDEVAAGLRPPGPEAWAIHVARTCTDAADERDRLRGDREFCDVVTQSRELVLSLGPAWRGEELDYIAHLLSNGRTPLPALRPVIPSDDPASCYELTHVVFYATGFGRHPDVSALGSQMASTALQSFRRFASSDFDLAVELALATRYLSGGWPTELITFLRTTAVVWAEVTLGESARQGHRSSSFFLARYHPLLATAIALSSVVANGDSPERARDEL
jgi:hypothetical protein